MNMVPTISDAARIETSQPHADKPLRIALFSGNYNYVVDGPVLALNRLVRHLETKNHQVLIFAPTIKNPPYKHAGTLISAPSIPIPGRGEYRATLGMSQNIRDRLNRFKPDLIHVAAPDLLGHGVLKYARKHGIPAVASYHTRFDTYPRYYNMPWLEGAVTRSLRRFYAKCEHVYAPSQSMIDELKVAGIGRDLRLWTRGVDQELFNPQKRDAAWRQSIGFNNNDNVVAFVGRLVLEKGLDVFAKSLAQTPGAKALIVGDGPERAHFESMMPNAVFIGYQADDALARAYASADIFFNPSVTETFGNVTLEAMASGLPSVCANAAGSASLIKNGETGLLCEPSVDEFAKALTILVTDKPTRKRMAENARAASYDFSWEEVLNALIGNYRIAIDQFDGY